MMMMMMRKVLCVLLLFLQWVSHADAFVVVPKTVFSSIHPPTTGRSVRLPAAKQQPQEPQSQSQQPEDGGDDDDLKSQAQELLRRAQEIRASLPDKPINVTTMTTPSVSEFRVDPSSAAIPGEGYRFYVSIGREEGTWMDARWGASGRRIEFSLDVLFCTPQSSTQDNDQNDNDKEPWRPQPDMASRMVQDNLGGRRSATWRLVTAPYARLQQGFDRMKLTTVEGAYRVDANGGAQTVRFLVSVEGTPEERGGRYGYVTYRVIVVFGFTPAEKMASLTHTLDFACACGTPLNLPTDTMHSDIFVPRGCLYFSVPCFGDISRLSTKEGPVTVRQMGWHTGWRREESRIVGTFRAVPMAKALQRDSF